MDECDGGGGSWLVTYADFITLMMIFFIVIYTFTPGVSAAKFEMIIGAFNGKRGVLDKESVFSDEMLDIEVQKAKNAKKKQEVFQSLLDYVGEKKLGDDVQVQMLPDGVLIILGERVTFNTYSAQLLDESKELLSVILGAIGEYTDEKIQEIEIQGHTDNVPVRPNATKYKSNWELGAARAASVLFYLEDNSKLLPQVFKASTYSEYRPRVENTSDENRRKNRRVEIYVQYESVDKKIELMKEMVES